MIEIKSEIEKIKQNTAADCKWIWVHKDLICILCWALMALWLLKYAHQAGNIWIAYNDVEIYKERSLGITVYFSFQSTLTYQGVKKTLFKEVIVWKFCTGRKPICKPLYTSLYPWISASQCLKQSNIWRRYTKYMTFAELLLNKITLQHAQSNVKN